MKLKEQEGKKRQRQTEIITQPKKDRHVILDFCAETPRGTCAPAARTTVNDHALVSGDKGRRMGKMQWGEAFYQFDVMLVTALTQFNCQIVHNFETRASGFLLISIAPRPGRPSE